VSIYLFPGIIICFLILIALVVILELRIAYLLNRRAQSHNMRRLEDRELSRRLEAQRVINMATGRRPSYLSFGYPPHCSLHDHPFLLVRFRHIIGSLNDTTYGVSGLRVVTLANNSSARSSDVLVYYVRNFERRGH
jgi:hypothetical protein